MLACARIGAIHSVVFGGFAAKELATRIDDAKPKLILSASLRHRGRARRPLQAAARRGDRSCRAQGRRLHHPAAPAMRGRADRGPRPRLGEPARRRDRREEGRALRAGARDRSALHPLHLGHDRHSEGRGARQWRPHGRARNGRCTISTASKPGEVWWCGLRHRLGGRPLLHRLCAAVSRLRPRSSTRASRSARRTPARSGASSPSTRRWRCSPRRPRSARSRRRTRTASFIAQIRPVEIPHAVSRRRARRSADGRMGRAAC